MADILDLNTEEEFEGVEGDREVRMRDVDEEEEETVSKLKSKAIKRKGRGFGGGRRGDSDADGDYDRLVIIHLPHPFGVKNGCYKFLLVLNGEGD